MHLSPVIALSCRASSASSPTGKTDGRVRVSKYGVRVKTQGSALRFLVFTLTPYLEMFLFSPIYDIVSNSLPVSFTQEII